MGVENLLTSSCEAGDGRSEGKVFDLKYSVDNQLMNHSAEAEAPRISHKRGENL